MNDWTGNSKSVHVTLGANNHSEKERVDKDFYATDPKAVKYLLEKESFSNSILEPCVGAGHIAEVLKDNGYNVMAMDIVDRGYPYTIVQDFLEYNEKFGGDIITNPPYKQALDMVQHSLELISDGHKVAMFLKIQFLEGKKRREFFKEYPPKYVYVFSGRVNCFRNGDMTNKDSSAVCYCWYIWEKGYKGEPIVRWIDN